MLRPWIPVVAYMAFIFTLSSIRTPPALPGGVDKDLHGILYAGLGALVIRALSGGWGRPVTVRSVVTATIFCALYGISDEFHQWFVPPRQVEALDVAADTIGGAVAAVGLYTWSRLTRSRA
jgi:VanZ family protein